MPYECKIFRCSLVLMTLSENNLYSCVMGNGGQLKLKVFQRDEGNSTNTCIHFSPSLLLKQREPQHD